MSRSGEKIFIGLTFNLVHFNGPQTKFIIFEIPVFFDSPCTSCSCIYYLKITSETSLSGYGCTRPQIMFVCVLLYIFAAQSTVSRLSSAVQGRISARSRETQRPCHCFYHPHRPTPPRCFKYIKHSFCTTLAGCKTLA